jgi:hypothetical protein
VHPELALFTIRLRQGRQIMNDKPHANVTLRVITLNRKSK